MNGTPVLEVMDSAWYYKVADDVAMAAPEYNDSDWAMIDPRMRGDSSFSMLNGVAWFRKHVYVPDSVVEMPLAINMSHYGASQVYVDGKLLNTYGRIGNDKEHTEYSNPLMKPVFFHFNDTGMHLIAVRYATYRTQAPDETPTYHHGFVLSITEANGTYTAHSFMRFVVLGLFLGLAVMFATLAGVHVLLWLFRTKDKSNLFLSILCGIFFIYFIMSAIWSISADADMNEHKARTTIVLFSIALVALSALLNYLFARIGKRMFIVVALCIVAIVTTRSRFEHYNIIASVVMLLIIIEASVLVIIGMRKKIRGSGVLAIGILPLTFTSLCTFILQFFVNTKEVISAAEHAEFNIYVTLYTTFTLLTIVAFSLIPLSMSVLLAWRFASVSKDLSAQLVQVKELSEKTQQQEAEKKRILENQKAELEREVAERTSEIIEEKKKSDDLLHNILPQEVASELKERGATTAHHFDHVTVLFTDFVDFTIAGERMGSEALVEELHSCFKVFDEIMGKHGIEKIKTIGDAYMAVCGLPRADERHAEKVVAAALEIRDFMQQRRAKLGADTFEVRLGVHSGEVVAGIVGVKKFAYDIWGDTVNTAARMEQNSEPGKINISQTTYEQIKDKFSCTYRGEHDAKNKGMLKMYFVE